MKRFLLHLIICFTSFNLAGGYSYAAAILNQQATATTTPDTRLSEGIILKKANSISLEVPGINKEESEEDDFFSFIKFALPHSHSRNQFIPDLRLFNKHFLVHYGKAIKGNFPALFLSNSVFRL